MQQTHLQYLAALRFFYRLTLKRRSLIEEIIYPKAERKLPVVLSLQAMEWFFGALESLKYRAILMTAYATGMRVSELLSLGISDIDSQRMVIRVDQGKGRSDRPRA